MQYALPGPDPISAELFRTAIVSLADEMALTIYRAAYSGVLKNIMDFSTAICDGQGRLVAQGLSLPGHLCSIPVALRACLHHFGDDIVEGDVLTLNDPYDGGMHLPDIFVFRPIFAPPEQEAALADPADDTVYPRRPVAWAATICHHTDVGGRVAGSNASDSTEIFAEGLRLPPLKLYMAGRPNETLHRIIEYNVRLPSRVFGDLRAQLAACEIASRGLAELIDRYGAGGLRVLMNATMNYSEALTANCLSELRDGEATFTDWIDDDQIDADQPIKLVCTIRKRGSRMQVDWTGSAGQVRGAINNTWSYTAAASFTAVKSVLSVNMPNNDGVFRAIEVIAPPGTIMNALPPAACAARGLTGFRAVDCCFGALAMLYPERVYAASDGGNTGISVGGYDAQRRPFVYVDFLSGAWGGRPWADGLDGNTNMFANMASFSIEVIEAENPLEVLDYEMVPDTGGAGLHRGGVALRRTWRMLADEGVLQVRADRATHRPYGLQGGGPGASSLNTLDPGQATEKALPSKVTMTFRRGQVFRHQLPGAGGWGNPLERPLAAVLADLREEKVSISGAERDYGVVARQKSPRDEIVIDEMATHHLRNLLRTARPKPSGVTRHALDHFASN